MEHIVIGILAHVDAGKTTLSEALLYNTGAIKNLGRVDNGDCFLDTNNLERQRGITIFSKQARFMVADKDICLLDTPGHVDFSAEMERTLQVLDYAILVISAKDKIQSHTSTLWKLLQKYSIPTLLFVNKMDQTDESNSEIIPFLQELHKNIFDFSSGESIEKSLEEISLASLDEKIINSYLDVGTLSDSVITDLIRQRKIYPVVFGSALKNYGVERLIEIIGTYFCSAEYGDEFLARVYKISKDEKGVKLAHLKILGGTLNVRDRLSENDKISQIRLYNGDRYESVSSVSAGQICTVSDLSNAFPGQGIGDISDNTSLLEAVISYCIILPKEVSSIKFHNYMLELGQEMPDLLVQWDEKNESTNVCLLGQMQIDMLKNIIKERYDIDVEFDHGKITYKETICDTTIGVGHFEPLRHYAEVHLKLEPGERGSGITVSSDVSEDLLSKNWIRLIKTHILEKKHIGVLTGSVLTDVHISIIAGKAHNKHTEGGDFRQATYRAIRQGLMSAANILLEPYYNYTISVPEESLGSIMAKLNMMDISFDEVTTLDNTSTITGYAPVILLRDIRDNLSMYTKGLGEMEVSFAGYDRCHNEDAVIKQIGYNPDEDNANPSSSVFCSHGAGMIVSWYQVREHMHVNDYRDKNTDNTTDISQISRNDFDYTIGTEEIDEILSKTYNANNNPKKKWHTKNDIQKTTYTNFKSPKEKKLKPLHLIDGYNIIFAWDELKEIADTNMDAAKSKLISILSNYQGIIQEDIHLVFDGYKAKGNPGSMQTMEGITVIHTKENVTADCYIEQFAYENRDKYFITVASSDRLIQLTTGVSNCKILSARDLKELIEEKQQYIRENYIKN